MKNYQSSILSTGMAKENIEDIGHMLSGYADIVVVRHGDL